VELHGHRAHVELLGDLRIAEPSGDSEHHLALPLRDRSRRRETAASTMRRCADWPMRRRVIDGASSAGSAPERPSRPPPASARSPRGRPSPASGCPWGPRRVYGLVPPRSPRGRSRPPPPPRCRRGPPAPWRSRRVPEPGRRTTTSGMLTPARFRSVDRRPRGTPARTRPCVEASTQQQCALPHAGGPVASCGAMGGVRRRRDDGAGRTDCVMRGQGPKGRVRVSCGWRPAPVGANSSGPWKAAW
jgi:hypothetical protein